MEFERRNSRALCGVAPPQNEIPRHAERGRDYEASCGHFIGTYLSMIITATSLALSVCEIRSKEKC